MTNSSFTYLSDYKPYPYEIPRIELDFSIESTNVIVRSLMKVEPRRNKNGPMILMGLELKLIGISINGKALDSNQYILENDHLFISKTPSKPFDLVIITMIDPFKNSSLEGLYKTDSILASQCEAEGFRRICFHPDRPDVLSTYRVRIEAEKKHYPILLSNGNKLSEEDIDSEAIRHEVIWDDPHPKPSYLFALVAGELEEVQDHFQTLAGKDVLIRLHVQSGDEKLTSHALSSLKRAMSWDERVYGLEYDLDEYNIVAVRHFNMGAMENKSLNIFNSKLILADSETATDSELERIESVVAHEYFHNWTGNRITCRDWFQLSLKEGLTVFRDQCFTSDLHSEAIKRIDDVCFLRNTQFREDASPTSHAVKPKRYKSIDNFYTTTIYEKGAELIRMLYTLLGHSRFIAGFNVYIKRFDGSAATTEDFIKAISEGACMDGQSLGFDLDQFSRWYYQRGTPKVFIQRIWDPENSSLELRLRQENIGNNQPFVIPISVALVDSHGRLGDEKMFVLDQLEQSFKFDRLPLSRTMPSISIFRRFSAPVNWNIDLDIDDLFLLLEKDDDPFSRWDAAQSILRQVLLSRASLEANEELEDRLIRAFGDLIRSKERQDPSLLSTLLSLPGVYELEASQEVADPIAIYESISCFKKLLGIRLSIELKDLLSNFCRRSWGEVWPMGKGGRHLTGIAWSWLVSARDQEAIRQVLEAVEGPSMTLSRAALSAILPIDCYERDKAMDIFYTRWKDHPVILDAWFSLKASIQSPDSIEQVQKLLDHPKFDPKAPNVVRAVLGGFASNTPAFHAIDGSGYIFLAKQLVALDKRNPITASRMVKVFSRWRSYEVGRQKVMLNAIDFISKSDLSTNTREVVDTIQS